MENKENLIWYVCYGSNLKYARFMKYINNCECKDKPITDRNLEIHYQLYFANHSSKWHGCGVCFIVDKEDPNVHTYARAYLITKEQFEDLWVQEGKSDNWYGQLIELGEYDGIPQVTFTAVKKKPHVYPHKDYLKTIEDGLVECGVDRITAIKYLKSAVCDSESMK